MSKDKAPAYGIYPLSTVRDVAESLGFEKTSDDVCRAVAGDVEFRLSLIIQEAQKFMRHAKRNTMLPSDVEYALQALNVQPILHPPAPLAKPTFVPVFSPADLKSNKQPQLYYLKDEEIDLATFLKGTKETPVPAREGSKAGVTWKAHWLAVEGVQPLIKENPVTQIADPSTAFAALHNLENGVRRPMSATKSALLARTHLSQELQLLFSRLTEAIVPDPALATMHVQPGSTNAHAGPSNQKSANAALSDHERTRQAALSTLLSDPGLAELLPYLIRWLSENVLQSVTNGPMTVKEGKEGVIASGTATGKARTTVELGYLMDGLEALAENTSLFVEPYLHQFLPPIMSVLLSVPLGAEDDPLSKKLSPKALRTKAADLLGKLMKTYAADYETLLPRVIKTLNRALATVATPVPIPESNGLTASPLGRYEGALLGLKACGKQAVVTSLLKQAEGAAGTGLKELEGKVESLQFPDKVKLFELVVDVLQAAFSDELSSAAGNGDVDMDAGADRAALMAGLGNMFGDSVSSAVGGKLGRLVVKAMA